MAPSPPVVRNKDWAIFEKRALDVLDQVAKKRLSDDIDEKNQVTVVADLVGRNRDTEVAPYMVLGKHGRRLLGFAMDVYKGTEDRLDDVGRQHLLDLFQAGADPAAFLTARMRNEAALIKRYPLANWG